MNMLKLMMVAARAMAVTGRADNLYYAGQANNGTWNFGTIGAQWERRQ